MQWLDVCSVADLRENSGVCALVNGLQIAIFYLPDNDNAVYAINNYDPIGKANVLSRGIMGDIKGEIMVSSPLYKQHFSLETGACLEDKSISVPAYACRIEQGRVEVDTRPVALLRQFIETGAKMQLSGVAA